MWDNELTLHKHFYGESNSNIAKIGKLLLPWLDWQEEDTTSGEVDTDMVENLVKRWEAKFGKIDSPEVQSELRKLQENVEDVGVILPMMSPPQGAKWISKE